MGSVIEDYFPALFFILLAGISILVYQRGEVTESFKQTLNTPINLQTSDSHSVNINLTQVSSKLFETSK